MLHVLQSTHAEKISCNCRHGLYVDNYVTSQSDDIKHIKKIQMRWHGNLERKGFASNLNVDGKGLEARKLKLRRCGIANGP